MTREPQCVHLGHYWIRQAFEDQASYLACLCCGSRYESSGPGAGNPGPATPE